MEPNALFRDAQDIAVRLFMAEVSKGRENSEELREEILDTVLRLPPYSGVNREALRAELERKFSIVVDPPKILESQGEHQPWLQERKASGARWPLWESYREYLLDVKRRPPAVVSDVDVTTDEVLGRLEDPLDLDRQWDRRGMVVGQVQSGKTANFTGLICKAIDAGYKLVIVLAGPYNNLRSQTQGRLDEELLGFDTSQFLAGKTPDGRIGVGKLRFREDIQVIPLTTRLEGGDFSARVAGGVVIGPGESPILMVVKKNATVLKNVLRFFSTGPSARLDPEVGRNLVAGVPLLLIDDEADYGSVNTADVPRDATGHFVTDYDPTTINRLIRQIIMTFRQSGYVGYTATPFANILIHSDIPHAEFGADLFPESFIIALQAPTDYLSPARVFGLSGDTATGPRPLPLVRIVSDYTTFMPDGHKNGFQPTDLCESVKEAIRAFVLVCAARRGRGAKSVHNSMLIHVTRFNITQEAVSTLVAAYLAALQNRLEFGDGAGPSLRGELEAFWQSEFGAKSREIIPGAPIDGWASVDSELLPAVKKMRVLVINGTAGDVLDYRNNEDQGINAIVIGGDKLSRGLTLEGLSISYYLRASKMYDTLLQMGRWFGYRPGYLDLCRIYTTDELEDRYRRIAAAEEELRGEFANMAERKETPRTYGLRVRSHPGLLVTSQVKMRHGITLDLDYAGDVSETIAFDPQPNVVKRNFSETDAFLRNLSGGRRSADGGRVEWRGVPSEGVVHFLRKFATHPDAVEANSHLLAQWIEAQAPVGAVRDWTVILLDRKHDSEGTEEEGETGALREDSTVAIGGVEVTPTRRAPIRHVAGRRVSIRRLVSPRHETLDISDEEWRAAEEKRRVAGLPLPARGSSRAQFARETRPMTRGLLLVYPLARDYIVDRIRGAVPWEFSDKDPAFELPFPLIGLALSLPSDAPSIPVKYTVNNVWWEREQGLP
ncbi:MAG: Z1 domain-containing protein [Candidatus Lutacidiplasmatales archaeon]